MKTKINLTALALAMLSTLNSQLATSHAQGTLTPPGAPAPTMKSLDQVEARTAITNTSSLVTISQPGSYYLTGNLTVSTGNGINITTNGVTLDLNGLSIRSTTPSATSAGILLSGGLRNITIANGFIQGGVTNNGSGVYSGSGFANGIAYSGNPPVNVLVSRVSISGCLNSGINLGFGDSTMLESCIVRTMGTYGLYASMIKNCTALDCGNSAIFGSQVCDSRGDCTGSSYGISAVIVQNSYGSSNSGIGLFANKIATGCHGTSSSGTGLNAFIANSCSASSLFATHNVNSF